MVVPEALVLFLQHAITISDILVLPQRYPHSDDLVVYQLGYKVEGNTGADITGKDEGDFQPNCYVISQNYFADPYFINIDEESQGFPVYFAYCGSGDWQPILVCQSLTVFFEQLKAIQTRVCSPQDLQDYLKANADLTSTLWQEVYEAACELNECDLSDCNIKNNESEKSESLINSKDVSDANINADTWSVGQLIITDLGDDKFKVLVHLKQHLCLTPQQLLTLSKQSEIIYQTGLLILLKKKQKYLQQLGATTLLVVNTE
jgi:hypothetical protein